MVEGDWGSIASELTPRPAPGRPVLTALQLAAQVGYRPLAATAARIAAAGPNIRRTNSFGFRISAPSQAPAGQGVSSVILKTPPDVPAYRTCLEPGAMARLRTSRLASPSLKRLQLAPPSELRNTPPPEVPA